MGVTLVSTVSSRPFADRLAVNLGVEAAPVERRDFPDGERYLRFAAEDRFALLGQDVVIVGATESGESLDDVYRLAVEAARHGARSLVLVVPYFGYSTMERATRPGEVVTAKVIARQLSAVPRATRGNWVLLMDLHTAGVVHYFEGDTVALELYAEAKIVEAIRRLALPRLVLASTDMGRAKWVEAFANKLHAPVALIHKRRLSGSQTRVAAVVGDVAGADVVIFDDMIRTGGSLVQAAEAYLRAGANSVQAAATHLVLPPGTVERLEASPLAHVIGTDTHPNHRLVEGRPRFEVVSVADLFADVVRKLVT
ncbi:MAG TPA: ribose-phosphate diphosphokinase [Gemmataceae bacterium]|jgi:ribose-phosphate pyrophosphokinase|nr:ribose-phosphate diphosphokinase [Gemmataceae bacterium]